MDAEVGEIKDVTIVDVDVIFVPESQTSRCQDWGELMLEGNTLSVVQCLPYVHFLWEVSKTVSRYPGRFYLMESFACTPTYIAKPNTPSFNLSKPT